MGVYQYFTKALFWRDHGGWWAGCFLLSRITYAPTSIIRYGGIGGMIMEWLNGKWKCVTFEIYSNSLDLSSIFPDG